MMRTRMVVLALLVIAGGAWTWDDALIAPGKSVGQVTRATTIKELVQQPVLISLL
jgi:hypothetical protein